MPVIAIGEMFGISGRRDELRVLLTEFERAVSGQPGCQRYAIAAALADPSRFLLVSEWDDREALDAHYRSQAFAEFQFSLNGLLARPSELTIYTAQEAVRPRDSGPMDPRDAD